MARLLGQEWPVLLTAFTMALRTQVLSHWDRPFDRFISFVHRGWGEAGHWTRASGRDTPARDSPERWLWTAFSSLFCHVVAAGGCMDP